MPTYNLSVTISFISLVAELWRTKLAYHYP